MRQNHHHVRHGRIGLLLAALAGILAAPVGAQDYPTRPLTLIVPYPAGGGVDAMGRIVAQHLSVALGQQVVVENRGGAAGVIGMRAAARSAADGYTLVMTTTGMALSVNAGFDLA